MTITRLGIHRDSVPLSVSKANYVDDDGALSHYNERTGMEYQIHEVEEGIFLEACHEDVGLVTWYSADNIDEVWDEIER